MTQDDFQKQVLDRLDALNKDVKQISKDNEKFSDRIPPRQTCQWEHLTKAMSKYTQARLR